LTLLICYHAMLLGISSISNHHHLGINLSNPANASTKPINET
jgi:hypothetical protein